MCVCVCVCMGVCAWLLVHAYSCMCMYVCAYMCVCVCVCVFDGWDFSGYRQISGFRLLSESNSSGVEMHFEYDFAPFRIQTLTQSHPWCVLRLLETREHLSMKDVRCV